MRAVPPSGFLGHIRAAGTLGGVGLDLIERTVARSYEEGTAFDPVTRR
jgi:hypothetical protein